MAKKALIVDDEDLVRNYVRRALASRGWEITEARHGGEALALVESGSFDAVVCDLKMPDLRGEEVVKRIRERKPGVKIVVITGSVSNLAPSLVPGVAIDGFLIKPFGIDEIRGLLEKLVKA